MMPTNTGIFLRGLKNMYAEKEELSKCTWYLKKKIRVIINLLFGINMSYIVLYFGTF